MGLSPIHKGVKKPHVCSLYCLHIYVYVCVQCVCAPVRVCVGGGCPRYGDSGVSVYAAGRLCRVVSRLPLVDLSIRTCATPLYSDSLAGLTARKSGELSECSVQLVPAVCSFVHRQRSRSNNRVRIEPLTAKYSLFTYA